VVIDAPLGRSEWAGVKPSELLLAALAGCTGVDFVRILAKQRQRVTSVSAEVNGEQDKNPPWAFQSIELVFTLRGANLDQAACDRALTLAVERYCTVGATLAGAVTLSHRVVIESEGNG
jgi:putative redox protein